MTYIDLKVRDAVALQKTKRCRRALQFFKLTPVSNIMEILFNFLCMMISLTINTASSSTVLITTEFNWPVIINYFNKYI